MSPSTVNGTTSRNRLPKRADSVLWYQVVNAGSRLTESEVVSSGLPGLAANWKLADERLRPLASPTMISSNDDAVREPTFRLVILGAARVIVIERVATTTPSSTTEIWMRPATLPVCRVT